MNVAFLSYTTQDGILGPALLEEIADGLSAPHDWVYVDLLHNDSRRPQQHLEEILRSSAMLYLVDTPGALTSRWVRREVGLARRLGISVTPVRHTAVTQVCHHP